MKRPVKILFRLEKDSSGYPPFEVESLWARPVDGGFELDNVPFYARGVAAHDIIEASQAADGSWFFKRVIARSGHSTYRLHLNNSSELVRKQVVEQLNRMGVSVEYSAPKLLALDVPRESSLNNVEAYLVAGKDAGKWDAEEAYRSQE